jgi:hypothetical protein
MEVLNHDSAAVGSKLISAANALVKSKGCLPLSITIKTTLVIINPRMMAKNVILLFMFFSPVN